MAFVKPSANVSSEFLKGAEHLNDVAILFEPRSIRKGVPHRHNGVERIRDELKATVTFFRTMADLQDGKPSKVAKDMTITYAMVVGTLEPELPGTPSGGEDGNQVAGVLRKIPTSSGSGYVIRDLDDDVWDLVVSYFLRREAAVAEAVAEAPDFD
ncbi:hypothetical protein [Salinispora tropica]|uniref:Uncharacterized protein n=1 Tax=Salinispora tropica (strain ATCC BAA-916 / DSM 44818 / JCM 13857 / NBRC 105044 / CNB-440) TaxID=369723 RepID=A4X2A6_SALTO|nr:hypothetical protein [Salinispora tropica]ABP53006.1 hypothetical protein Strop_0522 [Salinispora tropica CNB-440]